MSGCSISMAIPDSDTNTEVCTLLCINDEEKSGVVLGYFLCISQLRSQKAKGLFHLF